MIEVMKTIVNFVANGVMIFIAVALVTFFAAAFFDAIQTAIYNALAGTSSDHREGIATILASLVLLGLGTVIVSAVFSVVDKTPLETSDTAIEQSVVEHQIVEHQVVEHQIVEDKVDIPEQETVHEIEDKVDVNTNKKNSYCMECGSELSEGAKFCGECGTPVKK